MVEFCDYKTDSCFDDLMNSPCEFSEDVMKSISDSILIDASRINKKIKEIINKHTHEIYCGDRDFQGRRFK